MDISPSEMDLPLKSGHEPQFVPCDLLIEVMTLPMSWPSALGQHSKKSGISER